MQGSNVLYNYFRSSASYRVRIALHYKKIPFEYKAVHLLKNGGAQFSEEYKKLNPQAQVPCLIHNGRAIAQSMAIIEYLEALYPTPALFPKEPYDRAQVIQICEVFNSGIQPLQNLSVVAELEKRFGASKEDKDLWIKDWNLKYLASAEKLLNTTAEDYSFGNAITAADCFLVPQVFSIKRFGIDLAPFKKIQSIYLKATENEAFKLAAPERQPDYEA